MKKVLIKHEVNDVKTQLSIYSYLYAQTTGLEYSRLGEIYLVHVGDKGYFNKADGGGTIPKYYTYTLELLSKSEVENLVWELGENLKEEPEVDCDTSWQCSWCEFACPYREE